MKMHLRIKKGKEQEAKSFNFPIVVGADYNYFVCDDPFSPFTDPLLSIPDELIERVTIVDHIFDSRKFLTEGTYSLDGDILAYVAEERVGIGGKIQQRINLSALTVRGALDAIVALRRRNLVPAIRMEPQRSAFARFLASIIQ
jgi:hypothetical protein